MEQDKIDVTRCNAGRRQPARRGAPLWLQLLLSLIVIVAAAALAGLLVPERQHHACELRHQPATAHRLRTGRTRWTSRAASRTGPGPGAGQSGGRPQGGQGGGQPGGGGRGSRTAVVVAAPVVVATINDKLTAIGEGSAIHSVTVSSASAGTLLDVAVKPGTACRGRRRTCPSRCRHAADRLDRAQARCRATPTPHWPAPIELAKANSLSNVQLSAAQLTADNAKLELRNADLALAQRTITTPIAGTVGLIQVSPGNQVNAQTVVTTIEDASEILINFWVPERYASQIATGMPVDCHIGGAARQDLRPARSAPSTTASIPPAAPCRCRRACPIPTASSALACRSRSP